MFFRTVLILLFLFFTGSIAGWILELFYRRFFSTSNPERKWLNPGFLTGPWLPIYGFGCTALFLISLFEESYLPEDRTIWTYCAMFLVMTLVMTLIEYIGGLIFIKGLRIKLWDYSDMKGNIQGIICPQFALVWGVISALFYFLLYPPLIRVTEWFLQHIEFSYFVGAASSLFILDAALSIDMGTRIRKYARTHNRVIVLQEFERHFKLYGHGRFFRGLPEKTDLEEGLNRFIAFVESTPAGNGKRKLPKMADDTEKRT